MNYLKVQFFLFALFLKTFKTETTDFILPSQNVSSAKLITEFQKQLFTSFEKKNSLSTFLLVFSELNPSNHTIAVFQIVNSAFKNYYIGVEFSGEEKPKIMSFLKTTNQTKLAEFFNLNMYQLSINCPQFQELFQKCTFELMKNSISDFQKVITDTKSDIETKSSAIAMSVASIPKIPSKSSIKKKKSKDKKEKENEDYDDDENDHFEIFGAPIIENPNSFFDKIQNKAKNQISHKNMTQSNASDNKSKENDFSGFDFGDFGGDFPDFDLKIDPNVKSINERDYATDTSIVKKKTVNERIPSTSANRTIYVPDNTHQKLRNNKARRNRVRIVPENHSFLLNKYLELNKNLSESQIEQVKNILHGAFPMENPIDTLNNNDFPGMPDLDLADDLVGAHYRKISDSESDSKTSTKKKMVFNKNDHHMSKNTKDKKGESSKNTKSRHSNNKKSK